MVMIGIMAGRKSTIDLGRLLVKRLSVVGSTLRSRNDNYKTRLIAELSEKVWPLFETGQLKPVIDTQLPITEAEKAFALIESNNTTGKVILTIN